MLPKTFNYLALQSFDYECTWWSLFQRCVVGTKTDIFIVIEGAHSPAEKVKKNV